MKPGSRKFAPKPLFRPVPKLKGRKLPERGGTGSRTVFDPRQLDFFEAPKPSAGDYIASPLPADLARRLLTEKAALFEVGERAVLDTIAAGKPLIGDERETLNGIFAKLGSANG